MYSVVCFYKCISPKLFYLQYFQDQIDELRKYVRQKNKEKVLRCYKDLVEKLFNLESSQDDTMQENGSKIEIGKGSFIKKFSKVCPQFILC